MYSLRLLGVIDLEGPSGPVAGRATQRRRLALLALLGSAGDQGWTRDALVGLLWPDATDEQARHLLSDSLYVVRQALGEEAVLAVGEVLRLNPEVVWSDVTAFKNAAKQGELREAVELYRGPLLDGFYLGDAAELEHWVDAERTRLSGTYAKALETLAQQAEDAGERAAAVEWWQKLAAHDPYDSRIALRLMQALVAAGNPAGALEHARIHQMLVEDELGTEPSAELLSYAQRLKDKPRLAVERAADRVGPAAPPDTEAPPDLAPPKRVAMPYTGLRRLVWEMHRRSLWQVLGIYLVGAWIGFEVIQTLTEGLGLPGWFPALALVLFIVLLPVVVATAFAQPLELKLPDRAGVARPARGELQREAVARRRRLTWRNAGLAFLGASSAWGILAAGWLLLGTPVIEVGVARIPVSPNRVAVLPFTYRGAEEAAYLGEGMTELLSTAIDGAGELTAVDPYVLLKHMEREPTAVDPEAIARRFGAGTYILGSILEAGGRLQASAGLYDLRRGRIADAEVLVGEEAQIYELTDDVARQLLVERLAGSGERLTRVGAATTQSLDAMKAYLQGEHWARVGKYDSAAVAYERAVALDTTFALAYYRLAANVWPITPERRRQIANAVRFSSRLSTRDSLMVAALDAFQVRHDHVEAERLYRRILSSYPDQVDAWTFLAWLLGSVLICRGHTLAELREAVAKALDLDPDHALALSWRAFLAAYDGDTATAAADWEHIAKVQPEGTFAPAIRAIAATFRGDTQGLEDAIDELRLASDLQVQTIGSWLAGQTGDLSAARRVLELLTEPSRSRETRARGHDGLAGLEWAGGRLQACRAERAVSRSLNPTAWWNGSWWYNPMPPFPKAELAAIRDTLAAAWQPGTGLSVYSRLFALGQLDAMTGQTDRALAMATELEARAEELEDDGNHRQAKIVGGYALTVRAQVAASQDRPETALRILEQIEPAGRCFGWPEQIGRWLGAELLLNLGRYEEALLWYEPFAADCEYNLEFCAPARFRMGEIYERLGEPELAARHYTRFLKLWQDCDPELRPYVEQAQRALERISAEPDAN